MSKYPDDRVLLSLQKKILTRKSAQERKEFIKRRSFDIKRAKEAVDAALVNNKFDTARQKVEDLKHKYPQDKVVSKLADKLLQDIAKRGCFLRRAKKSED